MNTPQPGTMVTVSNENLEEAKRNTKEWYFIKRLASGNSLCINGDVYGCREDEFKGIFPYIYPALKFDRDHVLTRAEIYAAMDAGYILVRKPKDPCRRIWAERDDGHIYAPYVWHSKREGASPLSSAFNQYEEPSGWYAAEERPAPPEPQKRLMTREEMMGFVANHTTKLVIQYGNSQWQWAEFMEFDDSPEKYQWATIFPDGRRSKPQPFPMVEV